MARQQLTIPMFPLNMVLFPGETKTIHIFEERYKQLISDCIQNEAHFGVPFVNQKLVRKYGTEVKINSIIKKYDNGEMDILIEGVKVFQLIEFSEVLTPKLYGAGLIQYEDEIIDKPSHEIQDLIKEYMWLYQQNTMAIDAFDHSTVFDVARLIDISEAEKYDLLKAKTSVKKEEILKPKIKLFIHLIGIESELKTKFILN